MKAQFSPAWELERIEAAILDHQKLLHRIRDDVNQAVPNPFVRLVVRLRREPGHYDELLWRLRFGAEGKLGATSVKQRAIIDLFGNSSSASAVRTALMDETPGAWEQLCAWECVRYAAVAHGRSLAKDHVRWTQHFQVYTERRALPPVPDKCRQGKRLCTDYGLMFIPTLPV